jgi:uncharacterized protein YjbI with pentapeptide repeats
VTDFTSATLTGSRFEDVYPTNARFHDVDLTNARFNVVDMTGADPWRSPGERGHER